MAVTRSVERTCDRCGAGDVRPENEGPPDGWETLTRVPEAGDDYLEILVCPVCSWAFTRWLDGPADRTSEVVDYDSQLEGAAPVGVSADIARVAEQIRRAFTPAAERAEGPDHG